MEREQREGGMKAMKDLPGVAGESSRIIANIGVVAQECIVTPLVSDWLRLPESSPSRSERCAQFGNCSAYILCTAAKWTTSMYQRVECRWASWQGNLLSEIGCIIIWNRSRR
eukprot:gnl/MRDRNA2_/MRDRNA2_382784_c0_seq1.p1 gnl/MRDRNA2_/MRDRNA2_382784_c0~~gnl/MRDRNA2_/MRDRNA2_382784_c0_seq1.p1  ORF type:complete len:112 (+),score=5.56 gnl/MRDRNA2_/MRDRNA2_382784_c0_seq1:226-561(+)